MFIAEIVDVAIKNPERKVLKYSNHQMFQLLFLGKSKIRKNNQFKIKKNFKPIPGLTFVFCKVISTYKMGNTRKIIQYTTFNKPMNNNGIRSLKHVLNFALPQSE